MKPISIAFKCFGPYLEEQKIDFTKLRDDGLFLICGETGSGKTTILEAMSYALYEQSTGGIRGKLEDMRHEAAPQKEATYVEYIFESQGTVYRFYRSILPKDRRDKGKEYTDDPYNRKYEIERWVEGHRDPKGDWKESKTGMNEAAAKLTGLTHDQFCQVVILPQGKFEKFLVSKSSEKEGILKSLFRTDRWEKAAGKIKEMADGEERAVKEQRKEIERDLKKLECDCLEKLEQVQETAKAMVEQIREKVSKAIAFHGEKQKEYTRAIAENKDFEDLKQKKEKFERLEASEKEYEEEGTILALAQRAELLRETYQAYRNGQKEKKDADEAVLAAKAVLERVEKEIRSTQEKIELHEKKQAHIDRDRQTLDSYTGKRELYASLDELSKKAETAKAALETAKQEEEKSRTAKANAETVVREAKAAREEAHGQWEAAQNRYLLGIGYEVAKEKLKEGEPCPVCGSRHHPDPAKPTEDHVTADELKKFEKKRKTAEKEEKTAIKTYEEAHKDYQEKKGSLTEAVLKEQVAQDAYDGAKKQCIEGIGNSGELEKAIELLKTGIEKYDAEKQTLFGEKAKEEGKKTAAEEALKKAEEEAGEKDGEWNRVKTQWETARRDKGFTEDRDYLAASMEPEERSRRETAFTEYKTNLKRAKEDYEHKAEELKGRQQPDIERIQDSVDRANEDIIRLNRDCDSLQTEIQRRGNELERLKALDAENRVRDLKAQRLRAYSTKLNGSNGISIQRYILGAMLSAITTAANEILKTIYDGRYFLYRTDEGSGQSRMKGLELGVYSYDNPEGRLVNTLSGGEKFLVSLCLAIGLSTIVQAKGEGGRMEALFIDEGFGSLDKARIDDAMKVLHYIRENSGLVGIISHVESIAGHINAKIRIKKTKNGSQCELPF